MPSRREFLGGAAVSVSAIAGCLGSDELVARCASRAVGSGAQHLREVAPIGGAKQVALGILVSEAAVSGEQYHAVRVRDSDDDLVASVPLLSNRDMSSLDPADYDVFGADSGELYAVPLGQPPVHGEYAVALTNRDGERIETTSIRFNCYAKDGALP